MSLIESPMDPEGYSMKLAVETARYSHGSEVETTGFYRETARFVDLPNDAIRTIIAYTDHPILAQLLLRLTCRHLSEMLPACNLATMCDQIAQTSHTNLIDWAEAVGYKLSAEVSLHAAAHGQLDMLGYLMGRGAVMHPDTVNVAARAGHLPVVQLLLHNCGKSADNDVMLDALANAASAGHVHVCEWIYAKYSKINKRVCMMVLSSGHKPVFDWLYKIDEINAVFYASSGGYLDNVKYILGKNVNYHVQLVVLIAIRHGHLDIIKYVSEVYPGYMTSSFPTDVCEHGRVHLLEWWRESGRVINYDDCIAVAAERGQYRCVEWLKENAPRVAEHR